MNIHTDGIEIKKNFVSNSVIDSIKNEVTKSQEAELKSGIREADKKFKSIKVLSKSDQRVGRIRNAIRRC